MRFRNSALALLAAASVSSSASVAQVSEFDMAESAARDYMTAFLKGDITAAAALTHPDTLARLQDIIFEQLAGPSTPADLGLSISMEELRELSAESFYVAVIEANRVASSEGSEAMRDSRVEVIGSREAPDGAVAVELRMFTPNGRGGFFEQQAEFFLRIVGGEWKVVSDESQQ